ncbi:BLUF domain-containing protein [Rubrivirga litoralis]|uniref:BLUF domain-containing protein n=1 Tax=Rubrivirga litoralis TaxID=3075598 RepID=A0ABU3BN92_9BACT|nr:BLUF domain-containing protein [Rubrivirga sp. F394]MDT0630743.1 BLUF domain-containing protein [Rubrivirga sp. F394]
MHALLYRSLERPGLLASGLNDIIEAAQRRNRRLDVTGLLLRGHMEVIPGAPGEFVQWLEGPEEALGTLLQLIDGDPRHTEVEVLARGPLADVVGASHVEVGPGRLFPSWSMGLVRLAELPATLDGFLRFAADWNGEVHSLAA